MPKRITIIDGHPDSDRAHLIHALADAYAEGAASAGHEVKRIALCDIDVPFLRSPKDWEGGEPSSAIRVGQEAIGWAEHLVFLYPLWLGSMPALLKAFLEQVMRPGFAIRHGARTMWPGLLKGKSARIVVTMGMPAFLYRWYFRAHSLRSFERNILAFVGIGPVKETLIGNVGGADEARHRNWLETLRTLGREGR